MEKFRNRFAAYKRDELASLVKYYEKAYLPELMETTGLSQQERLEEMAKDELIKFDPRAFRPTKIEKANYLRRIAIEARGDADNFDSNVHIKWRRLRECIEAIHELKTLYPILQIYSNHWLSIHKPVKVAG